MLVSDVTVFVDNECFWHTVNAPVNSDSAIQVGSSSRVGVAESVEPGSRVVRFILIVMPMCRNDVLPAYLQQQGMFLPAGYAPRSKNINQRNLALEVAALQPWLPILYRR